jgi:hypothetical protein
MVNRRDFITLFGAAPLAWPAAASLALLGPRVAHAQQPTQKILRVGTAQILSRSRAQWVAL